MRIFKIKNIILLLALMFLAGSLLIIKDNNAYAAKTSLPLNQLQAFSEVYLKIKQNYVQDISDKELFDNAIKGMLEGLDPHSTFLNEKDFKDLQIGTKGEFGGLGIEVTMEDGFVKVITPIDDTPAYKAGVKAGDLIIEINKKSVKGQSLNQAVDQMRGKIGSPILLTIARKGETGPLEIKIIRAKIVVKSVKYELIDNNYGYIRISSFQNKTGNNLYDAISNLKKEAKGNIKGFVLDMRNNPGGVLGAAVDVSDAFIKGKKKLVFTKGKTANAIYEFNSNNTDLAEGKPIVVLINGGSASASEIVAGALQDHNRAVIMGTQSFGKGSVQTILPITSKTAVKITTARYYTPNGRSIQAKGITPDIIVKDLELSTLNENKMIKESDLKGHLENTDKKNAEEILQIQSKKLENDYQLSEAINLLKGLHIISLSKK
ncbi:MAG: S41 family peptidase [Gammaproteobacteria bacterium]|jgi:carboxyl-terminal processing protease|nr:S41 family peptidase [Gammaproteobacteria bacterium]|tara:strand:+ start:973 stop:2271 length:1299 start_codon:yes stop_codon:yes gene_type:complete